MFNDTPARKADRLLGVSTNKQPNKHQKNKKNNNKQTNKQTNKNKHQQIKKKKKKKNPGKVRSRMNHISNLLHCPDAAHQHSLSSDRKAILKTKKSDNIALPFVVGTQDR